jgi:hypothetical protein
MASRVDNRPVIAKLHIVVAVGFQAKHKTEG